MTSAEHEARCKALRGQMTESEAAIIADLSAAEAKLASLRTGAVECIPNNWLDPLLTGPNAVIHDSPPIEVEDLLNALRERVRALLGDG